MIEVWRKIPDTDFYEASSLGRIRSVDHVARHGRSNGTKRVRGCVLRPYDNGKYLTVAVHRKTRCVHELVALAFHGAPPTPDHEVRHLNGQRLDIRPGNLVWGTRSQNQMDRFAHGTACEGEKNYHAVLTEPQVRQIMALRAALGPTAIAKAVGCARHLVKSVLYGSSWNWLTGLPRNRHVARRKMI